MSGIKILLDGIFGKENFRNEISWRRSLRRSSISRILRRAHDVILLYSKSEQYAFYIQHEEKKEKLLRKYSLTDERGQYRLVPLLVSGRRNGETGKPWRGIDPNLRGKAGMHWITIPTKLELYEEQGLIAWTSTKTGGTPCLKYYLDQNEGIPLSDFWDDIDIINSMGRESLGYPTQKPQELLERIIACSSKEGYIVLDPFCGCGTTMHAAQKLRREWIGIDITHLAISLIEKRLKDAFPGIEYEVHGTPKDLDGARALADQDKYQFQWWAVSLVNAVPFAGKEKGADTGIDGLIYFKPEGKTTEKAIVSVKGGENVNVAMVRDLAHVVDRENAKIGVFITLSDSTGPMRTEAVKAGFYETLYGKYPKIQILTIRELFEGKQPNIPLVDSAAFRKAPKEAQGDQNTLPF
ncbi:MAG: DNA methyltransferase [Bryobacteraceae bacterium]